MKKLVLSAVACTALACPGFADDQLFVVECPAEPEAPIAEVVVDAPVVDTPTVDPDVTPAIDADLIDPVKGADVASDGPVDITAVIDDGVLMTTNTDSLRNDEDGSPIIYLMSGSSGASSDAPPSVNQLADEQRNSLRLFSGREASSDKAGKSANLKEFFAARSTFKGDTTAKSSTAMSAGERDCARRKAEIDQLRDRALRTGDSQLMSQADAMAAAQARTGTKSRGFFGLNFGRK